MYVENASFIKNIEVDNSSFECNPQCDKKYMLRLEWDTQNESWLWKVKEWGDVGQISLSDLDDVDITNLQDWQVIAYNWATGKFQNITIDGSSVLTSDLTTNVAMWGIPSWTTFTAGTSLESIIRQLLVTYVAPTVSLAITPSTSPIRKGETISTMELRATVTKRSNDITFVRFYANDVLVNEITSGIASGGTFTYNYTPVNPIDDDITLRVTISDWTTTVNDSKSINFVDGSYFGVVSENVTNPTAADITALTPILDLVDKNYTKTGITATYNKLLYAYPAEYGDLTSIKDGNNFEYINSYTKSTVTIGGVSYNCYLLTEAVGLDNFTQIYS